MAIFTLIVLWWQALVPTWNSHLQVDIWVLWERLNYFIVHGQSFAGITGNEVLPATLLYLFVPFAMVPSGTLSYANFLPAMLLLNLAVLFAHYLIVKDKNVLVLSLLFMGPILLFRFDALVTLVMLLGLLAFSKEKYVMSGIWLGLATGMKVFPVILLPYLVLLLVSKKEWRGLLQMLVFFGEALLLPVVIYFSLGGTLPQVLSALNFHNQKLISIESLPGSLITLWSLWFNGHPPSLIPGNGIWAVPGPAVIFNKLWMIPVGIAYVVVGLKKKWLEKFDWHVPLTIILIFLIFSKNLNPQYMWWYMAVLPFTKPNRWMIGLTLVAALLNQLVFPIYYTIFVDNFYQMNQSYWVYYLLLTRNIILLVLTYMSAKRLIHDK